MLPVNSHLRAVDDMFLPAALSEQLTYPLMLIGYGRGVITRFRNDGDGLTVVGLGALCTQGDGANGWGGTL